MAKLLNVAWTYNFKKKHGFTDSNTKERFFTKKPRWNMKNFKAGMKNIKTPCKTTKLTWVNSIKLFQQSSSNDPCYKCIFQEGGA